MSEWPTKTIDEMKANKKHALAMGPFGSNIKADNFVKEGIPVIKGGNLTGPFLVEDKFDYLTEDKANDLIASNAYRGDIVITHRGTIGQVGLIPKNSKHERYVVSQSQLKLSLDTDKINPYFVYYYLRSPHGQHALLANSSQVGVPAIAQALTSIRKIKVPYPDKDTQDGIVDIILTLDDKIELNQRMNESLEAMARGLFKSWFVDFDPVRAKAEGRKPEGMDAATSALFSAAFNDDGLPDGWELAALERIADLNSESWGNADHPNDVEYVDLANTKWGTIESTQHFSWYDAPSRARRVLRQGDTIVGTVRPGNGSFSFIASDGLTGSTGFAVLRPKKGIYREAVWYGATSKDNIDRLAHLADGGAYPAVRPDVVLSTPFIYPGDKILAAFSQSTAALLDRAEANKQENKTLSELRDTLLPKLISGELRIDEAKRKQGK